MNSTKNNQKQAFYVFEGVMDNRTDWFVANDSNLIIFYKETGEYWRKFIEPNEGPTDWEKQMSPISTSSKQI